MIGVRSVPLGPARTLVVLGGLAAAMTLRVAAGLGTNEAGVLFAVLLLATALAAGWRPAMPRARALAAGVGGAAVLCLAPALLRLGGHTLVLGPPPLGLLPAWATVTVLIAVSEEALLRGVLIDSVTPWAGELVAVGVAAVAFGLLHVPLYGWTAVPLDIAVGVWLGGLRLATGGVAAPATAHTLADLASWWLR
ncbi:MAG TPA: CPBP family intramembrane glutamic endopeptidase [Candidatus Dormibacteraeota bacterium]|nr:CPBP family intramembrane glutamic endopeptidase [Candidatus Dormibacteraeota bacterium]